MSINIRPGWFTMQKYNSRISLFSFINVMNTKNTYFLITYCDVIRPNYITISDKEIGILRIHYVDEGKKTDPAIILLHGEPSWSYIYRHMIPILSNNGFRVVAPDLIGFGKSDKPKDRNSYTYKSHVSLSLIHI